MTRTLTLALGLVLTLAACATGGADGGGGERLPNRGFAPYDKVVDDAGVLAPPLSVPDVRLDHPAAVALPDGVALFVEVCAGDTPCRVDRADAVDGLTFDAPRTVLEDARGLHAPFVQRSGATWTLWAVAGDGVAIVRSGSRDGVAFDAPVDVFRAAEGEILGSPSVAELAGVRALYLQRGDALARAEAAGEGFGPLTDVYRPCAEAAAPTPDGGAATPCWPEAGLSDPEVRASVTATGRHLLRLAFAGSTTASGKHGIGFAASADGRAWSPFQFNPALDEDARDERAPTVVLFGDRYLLYFIQDGRKPALGVAVNAVGKPSERF